MLFNNWKKWVLISGALLIVLLVVADAYLAMQPPLGTPAADFTLYDVRGEIISLSDFKGKVVVLDFMATWCPHCTEEVEHLSDIYEEYSPNVVIIMIGIDVRLDTPETLRQYVKDYDIKWIVISDTENINYRDYRVGVMPTLVIIDKNGYIHARFEGTTPANTLFKVIDDLLSEK